VIIFVRNDTNHLLFNKKNFYAGDMPKSWCFHIKTAYNSVPKVKHNDELSNHKLNRIYCSCISYGHLTIYYFYNLWYTYETTDHISWERNTVWLDNLWFGWVHTCNLWYISSFTVLGTVQVEPTEEFNLTHICPSGHLLDFNTWKFLNRIRTGVAPV
jgi:hypothetical protein